jgi:glycosyltransferase 2 family protein
MINRRKWLLLLLASLFLSLAVPLTLGGLSQFRLLHRLSIAFILLLIFLKLISWVFNALRIKILVGAAGQEIGLGEAALTTISSEFAGITTPGAGGMAAAYAFLFTRLGLSLGTAVGVVGLIIVTDLAVYGGIISVAAIIQALHLATPPSGISLALPLLLIAAGAAYLFWLLVRHYRRIIGLAARLMVKVPWLARRRWALGRATVEFLRALRLVGRMTWFQRSTILLITLDFWLPRFLLLVIVVNLVAPNVPFTYLIMIQGVLHLGGQLSFIPGGVGVEDGIFAAFMAPFMGAEAIAFSLVIFHFFTFYWYLLLGGPIFVYKVGHAAWDLLGKKPRVSP